MARKRVGDYIDTTKSNSVRREGFEGWDTVKGFLPTGLSAFYNGTEASQRK
jgi:hypothetical protein